MCGRMNISDLRGIQALLEYLGRTLPEDRFQPRYNVSPGATLWAATNEAGMPVVPVEWGVVPGWARPGQFKRPLINARAESIREKPSFRHLIGSQRAIVPANGFYEWKRSGQAREAWYFSPRTGVALALAAIWQTGADGVPQCCLITTAANREMAPVHHRMPVLLTKSSMADWLGDSDPARIDELMVPAANETLLATRVTDYVNNARNEGAECIQPQEPDLFS